MIAGSNDVSAGVDQLVENLFVDAKTTGGIFTIYSDKIEFEAFAQVRKPLQYNLAATFTDNISQK